MKYDLSKYGDRPLYIRLYSAIREDILSGTAAGKLPSKRLIADELGISIITVEHAYDMLADEGYVIPVERQGYFVDKDGVILPQSAGEHHVPAASIPAEIPEFPFSALAKTMRRVISDYGDAILARSPAGGTPELRTAIADYLERFRGLAVAPEQIIVGAGAEYLYSLIPQLLGRDRTYGIESPSYEKIEQVYRASGVSCELLPLSEDGIGTEALASTEATVLHVTPYHSYPSGVSASPTKRMEYVRWAESRDGYIVEDDFESEFSMSAKPADTIYSIAPCGRIIYVNTFSRTLSPALRMGYMVLPAELAAEYEERLGFYSCTVPVFEQYVMAEFLSGGEFERHINRTRRRLRAQNK